MQEYLVERGDNNCKHKHILYKNSNSPAIISCDDCHMHNKNYTPSS